MNSLKQQAFDQRQAAILEATLELVNEHCLLGVTVDHIAQRSGIGKGTVYKHFASKELIFGELTLQFYCQLLELLQTREASDCPEETLRRWTHNAFEFYLGHREYRHVVQYCLRDDYQTLTQGAYKQAFEQLDSQFRALLEPQLNAGIASGLFRSKSYDRLCAGIQALFDGATVTLWNASACLDIDPQQYIAAVVDFMIAGLRRHND